MHVACTWTSRVDVTSNLRPCFLSINGGHSSEKKTLTIFQRDKTELFLQRQTRECCCGDIRIYQNTASLKPFDGFIPSFILMLFIVNDKLHKSCFLEASALGSCLFHDGIRNTDCHRVEWYYD
jgi:hypothetical protein